MFQRWFYSQSKKQYNLIIFKYLTLTLIKCKMIGGGSVECVLFGRLLRVYHQST